MGREIPCHCLLSVEVQFGVAKRVAKRIMAGLYALV